MGDIEAKYLLFGMGYAASVSARAINTPKKIIGTSRDASGVKNLKKQNYQAYIFNGEQPNEELYQPIANATHIIHSIAPDKNGDAVYNHFQEQLENAKNIKWLCYYSTIGVYGNHNGLWIDEGAKCAPKNIRSIWRLEAEQLWQEFAKNQGIPLLILRLAGIYGNGRSVFEKLKNGKARRIVKDNQVFNRIHVKDIAQVTKLAAQKKLSGIYNLCDDEPAPPQEVILFAADMAGLTPPKEEFFANANMSKMARSFYSDNKRVSNSAIKKALDIELLYPTYRQGLEAIYLSQK